MMAPLYWVTLYRHFAHAKYFALWLLMAFALVGVVAAPRRGRAMGPGAGLSGLFRLSLLLAALIWSISLLFAVNVGHGLEVLCRVAPVLVVGWWVAGQPVSWRRVTPWALGLMLISTAVVLGMGLLQARDFPWWLDEQSAGFQQFAGFVSGFLHLLRNDRWIGTLGNPNSAASFYAAALVLMVAIASLDRPRWRRIMAGLFAALLLGALLQTRSRSGLISSTAGILAVGLAWINCWAGAPQPPSVKSQRVLLGLTALMLAGGLILLLIPGRSLAGKALSVGSLIPLLIHGVRWAFARADRGRSLPALSRWVATSGLALIALTWVVGLLLLGLMQTEGIEKVDNVLGGGWKAVIGLGKGSFMDRLCIWKSGSEMLLQNPLIGIGWGQFPLIYPLYTLEAYYDLWGPVKLITTEEAHSGHLNIALETGLLGGAAWLGVLMFAWVGALGHMRRAAGGDGLARATLIWFPPALTLVVHMWVDKFLSYPASMVLMMWCLGQMVRPRVVTRGASPSARWGTAAGLAALVTALAAAPLPISLAVGSSGLAAGRANHERAKVLIRQAERSTDAARRLALTQQASDQLREAGEALDKARRLLRWEIDSWTRSIDVVSTIRPGQSSEEYLDWHRAALGAAPNYYPILDNLALQMANQYRRLRASDPETAEVYRQLAIGLFEHVRRLRPREMRMLFGLGNLLLDSGDPAGFEALLEQYLTIPGVDRHDQQRVDLARARLAGHHRLRGNPERALELLRDVTVRPGVISEFALWLQITDCQVALGMFREAWQELRGRMDTIDENRVGAVLAAHERRGRQVRSVQQAWELSVAYLALNRGREAAQLLTSLPTAQSNLEAWLLAATVARVASADVCRAVLASAEAKWPDSTAPGAASRELLEP